jgi:alpha-L-arabinofuranosidase
MLSIPSPCRFAISSGLLALLAGALLPAIRAQSVNIAVDATRTVRTVDERVFGLNTAIWDSACNTPETIALLQAAGFRCLRFPGGSASDEYHWQTNTSGTNTWRWATNFAAFANVASSLSAQVFITVNYGTGTPEEAAAWVTEANVTRHLGIRYWEIGNENYGASWEADQQAVPHDPYTYAVRTRDYITQM